MQFCTLINCMDGRVQLPAINFLLERFGCDYVDSITEPGPDRILAEGNIEDDPLKSILEKIDISVKTHASAQIAVAGHHDCAGYPAEDDEHILKIRGSVEFLRRQYPGLEIIGLWIDRNWIVEEIV